MYTSYFQPQLRYVRDLRNTHVGPDIVPRLDLSVLPIDASSWLFESVPGTPASILVGLGLSAIFLPLYIVIAFRRNPTSSRIQKMVALIGLFGLLIGMSSRYPSRRILDLRELS